uniref:C2H2-type domain-containing protein n=1 Tax=Anopheles dirus TaxID=7168 RepID=A0A182NMX5_9DIPT
MALMKCVICLEHASTMVPFDTEIDVDGLLISCEAMYDSITGIMCKITKVNPEAFTLKLCLACLTKLNDCFLFQNLAVQSAETIFRFSSASKVLTETDTQERSVVRTEICTNLEVDILNKEVQDTVPSPVHSERSVLRTEICTNLEVHILNKDVVQDTAPSPIHSEPPNSLYDTKDESLNIEPVELSNLPIDPEPACEDCVLLRANTTSFSKHFVRMHCRTKSNNCFQCTVCQRHFKSMRSFVRHVCTHLERKQFICQFCPKSFHYLHHLQIHERTHTHEMPYQCTECPKAFAAKDRLVGHERTHRQHAGVVCDLCQKCFRTSKSLLKHKLIKHDQAVARFVPCECSQCGKVLQSQSAVTYHLQHACTVSGWKMQPKEQTITCDRCKEKFRTEQLLQVHLESQHGQRALQHYLESSNLESLKYKYQCDVCGMKFKQNIVLVRHKQRHDGIRPYQCELCDRSFTQKGTLKTHMRRHTDEKPYECGRCGICFRSAASRRSHYLRGSCSDDGNAPDELYISRTESRVKINTKMELYY